MHDANPYDAPQADLNEKSGSAPIELAGYGERLGAAIVDAIINFIPSGALMYATGVFDGFPQATPLSFGATVLYASAGLVFFLLIHGYFLMTNGQTVGKKLVGIRITGLDDRLLSMPQLVLKRVLPVMVVQVIPVVGQFLALIDVLFIFRADRRCVHDLIAGTKVVRV